MRGPGNGDLAVFQGLPQNLQDIALEFRQFIKEKYAVVGERDLAWPGNLPASDETGIGNGMVRGAEGPGGNQLFSLGMSPMVE